LADELIEYLWPGCENLRSAASNLRGRVAELRKILGPSFLLTRRGGYALSAESDCWIDAEEFSHLEELGRRAYRQENYDEAIRRLQEAVALYRGEYLAEDRYEEWALQRRERYRERFVEVLSLLADSLARRGQYARALGYLERAIGEAPLQETLYRQLMVYAFCAGERARALGAYERCRAVLERELGERPSSQTEQLYRQIQSERVAFLERVYPRAAPPSLPGGMRRPPFVGRAREWERLFLALERARAAPFFVMLSGEAGVGKTRLGEEFLRWAHTQGVQTLYGRCYELESPLPWQPWREALRGAQLSRADLLDIPPLWLAELAEVLPELRSLCEFSGMELPGEFRRYRLFEALAAVIGAVAARAPLIVMLDDLQWADSHSLDFLCYLLEKGLGVLLVGAARAEELGGKLDRVCHQAARLGRLEEIPLGRLSEQELQELLEKLADDLEVPRDFGGRLYRESMGNPLLATAVLQALFENGAFTPQGGRWSLREVRVERVPGAEVWLRRRVQRVSAAAQRVFHLLACAGQLELAVIEAAWEGTSEELLAHLGELISQGLVSERGGRYECAHDKFREVVYEQLEEPRRIWLHRRIAQAIEHVYSDPPAAGLAGQVAQHYERGGQPLRALEWLFRAIKEHQKRYNYEEGLQLVERGLSLLQTLVGRLSEQERMDKEFDLITNRLRFYLNSGELRKAESVLERLVTLSERDMRRQAQVCLLQAQVARRAGHLGQALAAASAAHQLYRILNDVKGEVEALHEIGLAHFDQGAYREAQDCFERSYAMLRQDDKMLQMEILDSLGNVFSQQGELERALEFHHKALKICQELQDKKSEGDLLNNIGAGYWRRGIYQEALRFFEQAAAIAKEIGDRWGMATSLCNVGRTYEVLGIPDQALKSYEQAYALFEALESTFDLGRVSWRLGSAWQALGRKSEALAYSQKALELLKGLEGSSEEAEAWRVLGKIHAQEGEFEEAKSAFQQALNLAQRLQLSYLEARIWIDLSEVLLREGNPSEALNFFKKGFEVLQGQKIAGEFAVYIYGQYFRILQALQRPEALEALRAAQQELLKTADQITDPSLRTSFLNIPLHRQILTEIARA
jgi:predicted ATPase/DNA-binding SARP family transcriptional activator